MKDVGENFMMRRIQRIVLIGVLCFTLFGCNLLVKELYISVPPQIVAGDITDPFATIPEYEATVSTAFPVPDPFDGTSVLLTVHLLATGPGSDKLDLTPGSVEIEKGTSIGVFSLKASYDGTPGPDEVVTITATAPFYEEDSATITITFP